MWLYKYLVCLIRKHIFAAVQVADLPYQYCLRCGKFEQCDVVKDEVND